MNTQQTLELDFGTGKGRKFCLRKRPAAATEVLRTGADQRRQLLERLSEIGLGIVHEAHGPVPLLTFGNRVLERLELGTQTLPLPQFADALKRIIRGMRDDRLRVVSPTVLLGVGYVYNANEPETWPVRLSR